MTRQTGPGPEPGAPAPAMRPGGDSTRQRRASRAALAVLLGCQLMIGIDFTIVNIALPGIRAGLGFSTAGLAWVFNAYALAFGGLLLLGGRAGDIFGRRRVFLAGVLVFTGASLAGGFASAPWQLVTARAVQGAGGALASPGVIALIAVNFPEGAPRTRALSLFSLTSSASLAVGLILGGVLTSYASWRWVLFVNVPAGIIVAALTPATVRETGRQLGQTDAMGASTGTAGVTGLVYGFIRAASAGWADPLAIGAFTAAVALLAAFILIERSSARPFLPLRLLASRGRAGAYLGMVLVPAAMFDVVYFLTQYLQQVRGYSAVRAGLAFLPLTAAIFAVVRGMPRLIARLGTRPLIVAGAACVTAALAWLTQLTPHSGYVSDLLGPLLLTGAGIGLTTPALSVTSLAGVPPAEAGAASGVLQTMQWIGGGSLALAVFVTIESAASRAAGQPAGSPAAFTHGITTAFTAGAALAALAIPLTLLLIRPASR